MRIGIKFSKDYIVEGIATALKSLNHDVFWINKEHINEIEQRLKPDLIVHRGEYPVGININNINDLKHPEYLFNNILYTGDVYKDELKSDALLIIKHVQTPEEYYLLEKLNNVFGKVIIISNNYIPHLSWMGKMDLATIKSCIASTGAIIEWNRVGAAIAYKNNLQCRTVSGNEVQIEQDKIKTFVEVVKDAIICN